MHESQQLDLVERPRTRDFGLYGIRFLIDPESALDSSLHDRCPVTGTVGLSYIVHSDRDVNCDLVVLPRTVTQRETLLLLHFTRRQMLAPGVSE